MNDKQMFLYSLSLQLIMAKKDSGGFQSSAGLMRYFDTENDKSLKVNPKIVIGLAIGAIVIVLLLQIFVPM